MVTTLTDRLYGESSGVAVKAPVVAVSQGANLPLSGLPVLGGYQTQAGDRILVKDNTNPVQNGIYNAATTAWQRTGDFDNTYDAVNGTLIVAVLANGGTLFYQLTSPNPVTIGTSALLFQPFYIGPQVNYPISPPEAIAGVTPANLAYRYGSLLRYGADPTGTNPSDTALANALKCNSDVFDDWPGGGTYLFNTGVQLKNFPVSIHGQAKWVSGAVGVNGTKFILGSAAGANSSLLYVKSGAAAYGVNIWGIGFAFQSATVGNQSAISAADDLRYACIEKCSFTGIGGAPASSLIGILLNTSDVYSGDVVIRDNLFSALYCDVSLQGLCTTIKIYGNEFYGHAGLNAVETLSTLAGGASYTNGTYLNVSLTGGTGSGALANIVVSGGAVTSCILVHGGGGYTSGDVLSAAGSSIGAGGAGFSIHVGAVGNQYGFGVQCVYPVVEPVISLNYFEGFSTAIYSQGAGYLKQIANDYGPNANHWTWVKTSLTRIWNQSIGETFTGAGATNYPFDNTDLCQVLSGPGLYYLDGCNINVYQGFVEQGRTVANGHQQTRAFSAGNYTGGGGWTVTSGEVVADMLVVDGNHATYYFEVLASTVAGGAAALAIALPPGVVASNRSTTACRVTDNGTAGIGFCEVLAGGTSLAIYKDATAAANWSAASAATSVQGQISFPINYAAN